MTHKNLSELFQYSSYDVRSGIVVFLVALPLCLGIALASGAPLFSGLIAGICGGIVVGAISKSHTSVSGPAAGLTVIVLSAIETLGSFESFLVAVVLAGIIQLILGYAKAGLIALFFPNSVIKGMLSAIGLILILKQFPHFVGVDIEAFGSMEFFDPANNMNTFEEFMYAISHVHTGPLIVGVISLVILIVFDQPKIKNTKLIKVLPGPLIAVGFGILWTLYFSSDKELMIEDSHLVSIPSLMGEVKLSDFIVTPNFSEILNLQIVKTAFLVAIIASLETLLSIEAVDKLDPHKRHTPPNAELIAQGFGNIVSGLIGGLPVTSVIVRSSANIDSGAQTKLAAIYHGFLLAICVLLIPNILNLIPLSCLASVLLVVGYKLAKPAVFMEHLKNGLDQFFPFIITVVAILFSDLLIGILIGLSVGAFYILKSNFTNPYDYEEQYDQHGKLLVKITLSEYVSFMNKAALQLTLDKIPDGSKVIIDGSNLKKIDLDALNLIADFVVKAKENEIELKLIKIPAFN